MLYYFNITNQLFTNIIKVISILLSSFTTGFYIGKKSKNNGYINGLIQGTIIILILLILNIIFSRNVTLIFFIIYILIIITTTIGSIIGINKKK
jgi:putative membrane protein (TIGR04086 family)